MKITTEILNDVNEYLKNKYGLDVMENVTEVIHVRVSQAEKLKISIIAMNENKTTSELVRDFIRGL